MRWKMGVGVKLGVKMIPLTMLKKPNLIVIFYICEKGHALYNENVNRPRGEDFNKLIESGFYFVI